jgi:hypothetical protein
LKAESSEKNPKRETFHILQTVMTADVYPQNVTAKYPANFQLLNYPSRPQNTGEFSACPSAHHNVCMCMCVFFRCFFAADGSFFPHTLHEFFFTCSKHLFYVCPGAGRNVDLNEWKYKISLKIVCIMYVNWSVGWQKKNMLIKFELMIF